MFCKGRILALDSASDVLAIGLGEIDDCLHVLDVHDETAPRKANEALLGRIDQLLSRNALSIDDIDAVVVGRGPGSFTGVRIGVACAKGIACGLNVGLFGVSTLDAVAWHAWLEGVRGALGVVEDAMRKEVYPVRFDLDEAGVHRRESDGVSKPAAIAAEWIDAGEHLLLTGNGLVKHADHFDNGLFEFLDESLWAVSSAGLLHAFSERLEQGTCDSGDPATLLPVYTRLSDAEENERESLENGDRDFTADAHEGLFLHPLSAADVPAVVSLQERAMGVDAWTEGKISDELGHNDRVWWVARRDGEVVGAAGGQVVADELSIFSVCVDPEQRRCGIATRLLERVATDARALAAETVTLEVRCDNAPAIALYENLGLVNLGKRPAYYHDGADAYILRGELPLKIGAYSKRGVGSGATGSRSEGDAASSVAKRAPFILAIESSCDETAAAVVDGSCTPISAVIASQIDFHTRFGGVVPEIASRKHTEAIVPVVLDTMKRAGLDFSQLDGIAVTQGPGLVGALVVGLSFAKGLAYACHKPLFGVNHLEGHLYANKFVAPDLKPPFVALLVSGGHTMLVHVRAWGDYEVLGSTLDDAVGEAFDKVAKALGLGYPGGPAVSRLAAQGNPKAVDFPRAMLHSGTLEFSLSGLKTAVVTHIAKVERAGEELNLPDIAASFQAAVVDVQVAKALEACKRCGVTTFCMGGGVAANPALRNSLTVELGKRGIRVIVPDLSACTDNAAMIGAVGLDLLRAGVTSDLSADALSHMPLRSQ